MLLDKHEARHKQYVALLKEYNSLIREKYNTPWISLDRPYQDGWKLVIELRDDISRRADASMLQQALALVAHSGVTKNPKTVSKVRSLRKLNDVIRMMTPPKGQVWSRSIGSPPQLGRLTTKQYDQLSEKLKSYFMHGLDYVALRWGGKPKEFYELSLPSYYLVVKVKPAIVTHIKKVDPKVEKRITEIRNHMEGRWGLFYSRRSSWDRSDRAKSIRHMKSQEKVAIARIIKGETEDFEPKIKHKL